MTVIRPCVRAALPARADGDAAHAAAAARNSRCDRVRCGYRARSLPPQRSPRGVVARSPQLLRVAARARETSSCAVQSPQWAARGHSSLLLDCRGAGDAPRSHCFALACCRCVGDALRICMLAAPGHPPYTAGHRRGGEDRVFPAFSDKRGCVAAIAITGRRRDRCARV